MINPRRGEFELELGGTVLVLRYTMDAAQKLCEAFGVKAVQEVFSSVDKWAPIDYVKLVHAGAVHGRHPGITAEEISDLITIGDLARVLETISAGFAGKSPREIAKAEKADEMGPTSPSPEAGI